MEIGYREEPPLKLPQLLFIAAIGLLLASTLLTMIVENSQTEPGWQVAAKIMGSWTIGHGGDWAVFYAHCKGDRVGSVKKADAIVVAVNDRRKSDIRWLLFDARGCTSGENKSPLELDGISLTIDQTGSLADLNDSGNGASVPAQPQSPVSQPATHSQVESEPYTGVVAIPQNAPDIASFVPQDWNLNNSYIADGDLNGDGHADHAFIITQPGEVEFPPGQTLLVVVFATGDNQLQRVCVSSHIMDKARAVGENAGGGIDIKQGALIVSAGFMHHGSYFSFDNSFRWRNGRFELVRVEHTYGDTGGDDVTRESTSRDIYEVSTGRLHHQWSPTYDLGDVDSPSAGNSKTEWLADYWIPINCTPPTLSQWSWDDPQLAAIDKEYKDQPKTRHNLHRGRRSHKH